MLTADDITRLQDLIVATGATMTVADADGTIVYQRPLARMWRLDPTDPNLVWIRPIDGRRHDPSHGIVFSLSLMTRRSLDIAATLPDPDGVGMILQLHTSQIAHLHPATGPERDELDEFEQFLSRHVTDTTFTELGALNEDSWSGDWA